MRTFSLSYQYDTFDYLDLIIESIEMDGFNKGIIVNPAEVPVDESVKMACKFCPSYNKNYSCPPYSYSTDQIKNLLSKYSHGVLLVLKVSLNPLILKLPLAAGIYKKLLVLRYLRKMHGKVLEIEQRSRKEGHEAYGFIAGKCLLCLKCKINNSKCAHPSKRRYSMESVGIDVYELAKKYGIKLNWILEDCFYYMGLILLKENPKNTKKISILELGLEEVPELNMMPGWVKEDILWVQNLQQKTMEQYGSGNLYIALNQRHSNEGIDINKLVSSLRTLQYVVATYGFSGQLMGNMLNLIHNKRQKSKYVYVLAYPPGAD